MNASAKRRTVYTDEHGAYRNPLKAWKSHSTVVHSRKGEYSRRNPDGTVSGINSCESFFSLFKRGVYGSVGIMSAASICRNMRMSLHSAGIHAARQTANGHETAIGMVAGKRLTYRQVNLREQAITADNLIVS
jgi:hypothetical protein